MRSPHSHWHWYKHSQLSAQKRLKYKLHIIHPLGKLFQHNTMRDTLKYS